MSSLEQLDTVLWQFVLHAKNNTGQNIFIPQVTIRVIREEVLEQNPSLKNNEFITDFPLMIEQLVKDGYIDKHIHKVPAGSRLLPMETTYSINFNGKRFITNLGYQKEKIQKEGQASFQNTIQRWLAVGTFLAAIGTLGILGNDTFRSFCLFYSAMILSIFFCGAICGVIVWKMLERIQIRRSKEMPK